MPAVNRQQFWKSNPNQMALPGMEEQSHPGAKLLAQGYAFRTHSTDMGGGQMQHEINAVHPDLEGDARAITPHMTFGLDKGVASSLNWAGSGYRSGDESPGEIGMVETGRGLEHQGLATTLYGIARTMARVKPRHSVARTGPGDKWAKSTVAKYGGRVPKKNVIVD